MNLHDILFASKMSGKSAENADLSDYYTKSQIDSLIDDKVNKITGKGLSTNDFTDEYKAKIDGTDKHITDKIAEIVANAPADFDTLKEISDWIESHEDSAAAMNTAINNKVDKITGKGLSTNDFTTTLKNKLDGLSNYDDTKIKSDISANTTAIGNKVDKVSGKGLSTNDFTTTLKNKLNSLSNYDDASIKADIAETSSKTAINRSTIGYQRKNLLQNTAVSQTVKGVKFTLNADKSFTVSGVSTGLIDFKINKFFFPDGQKFILSGCPKGGTSSSYVLRVFGMTNTTDGTSISDYGNGVEFSGDGNEHEVRIVIGNGISMNADFFPMLRYTDVTDDTYEPYRPSVEERLTALETAILSEKGV
ncbi:MAG: hypothetical protein K2J39_12375 [Ruminococcus sp.]|nr:hypothetical protein [Ruminococcus sp.]